MNNPKPLLPLLARLLLCVCLLGANLSRAQDDSFDQLTMSGVAAFEQLRKEYYIGALYLESLSQTGEIGFGFAEKKRMELRITIDKWSPRRFGQQWNQAILINNSSERQREYEDDILAFIDMLKGNLVRGDRLTIDLDPGEATIVSINGERMFSSNKEDFFDLLLNTWIGQRPPSSDFKSSILTLDTDGKTTELLTRFEGLNPQEGREEIVARWRSSSQPQRPQNVVPSLARARAPDDGTTSRARRSDSAPRKKVEVEIERPVAQQDLQPEPAIELETPTLAAVTPNVTSTTPEPVSTPAASPSSSPAIAAASSDVQQQTAAQQEAEDAAKAEQARDELLTRYRSQVLRLTFLNTRYPNRAADLNQQGTVILQLTLDRAGKVLSMVEQQSSRHRLLNNAAQKAVRKTAPYPEIPAELTGDEVTIDIPFKFNL